jgi:hypothetical protein
LLIDASVTHERDAATNRITRPGGHITLDTSWYIRDYFSGPVRAERGTPPRQRTIGQLTTTDYKLEICKVVFSPGGLIPNVYGRGIVQAYTQDYRPGRVPERIDSYEDVFFDLVLSEAYILCEDGRFEPFDYRPYAT